MRGITLPMVAALSLLASAAPAQQPPAATGDTIGHPPPIPGPPPISEPSSAAKTAPANSPPPTPHQEQSLLEQIRGLREAHGLQKAPTGLTPPPVHRQPHTPQVHCHSRI